MFEEESVKWATKELGNGYVDDIGNHSKTYQKGAEFGYDKANEWKYPSKGELPKENCKVCLYAKDKECYMGFLENGVWKYEGGFYASDNFVIAWKEIVPPKGANKEREKAKEE